MTFEFDGEKYQFGGDGNCAHFIRVIREAMALDPYAPYFRDFDWPWYMPAVDEYRSLVQEFPFPEAAVWGENADRYFPDAEAMTRWIDQPSIVPFLQCVAEADKPSFRGWVIQRMIEETQQEDGRCFETFRRINLLARK
jgi:trans-aconitate methyltransferase